MSFPGVAGTLSARGVCRNLAPGARRGHTAGMTTTRLRLGLIAAAIVAALALGIAFGSEWYGGLVPCALCLVERWPYRIAIGLALIGACLPALFARIAGWLVVLTMLAGAASAFVHVGVENQWWPSPLPECAAPHFSGGTIAERLRSMPAKPSKACDEPTYLVPEIPLSFAMMNLLGALTFSVALAMFLTRNTRTSP